MVLASSGLSLLRNLVIIVVVGLAVGFARPFVGSLLVRARARVKSDQAARRDMARGNGSQGGRPKPTPVTRRHGRRRR